VVLDGEVAERNCQERAARHPHEFSDKSALVLQAADMLEHSVGGGDVE
jgi:hypothetical protein